MLQLNRSFVVVMLAISFFPTAAHAGISLTASDSKWKLIEETDATLQVPVCRAYTQAMTVNKDPVEFSLSYPKDEKNLPMLVLRTKVAPSLIAIKISNSESEFFFLLQPAASNADLNTYWYAPVNFSRMETIVRQRDTLDLILDPKGSRSSVQLSLAGSSNTIDAAKKCLKAIPFPQSFFSLLNQAKDNLIPDLGDRSPAFLFKTTQQAFDSFQSGRGIQAELAKLRATNKPLLDKESAALAVRKTAQAAFSSADVKLTAAKTQESSLAAKLGDDQAQLAALQAEKPLAETTLAQKKAIYTPLAAQMVPYDQAIANAGKGVQAAQADVTRNETIIAKNTKRIPELQNEAAGLNRIIPGLERTVRNLRNDYDTADNNYRRYDQNSEKRKILDGDAFYRWAQQDLEKGQRDLNQARSDSSQAQGALSSAQQQLGACRATPNAVCSAQEAAVNNAQNEVNRASSEESSAQSAISGAEWKIRNIEDDAQRKVSSESDRLRRLRDDAESEYDNKNTELRNDYARLEEIRNAIPVLRKQIETAQAALPALRQKLTDTQNLLAQKTEARKAFSDQIGFGVAEQEYHAAQAHLTDVNAGIAAKTKEIPQLTKDLAAIRKTLPALAAAFTKTQADLLAAEQKLAPIQEQLKPFRDQEGGILAALEQQNQLFKTSRAAYQDLIKDLLSH